MANVLFICTANICRSPMAMAIFRHKLNESEYKDWKVASAGTWARPGHPAPEFGRRLMSSIGMDISRHRSRVVTAELLDGADLILTMEQGHKEALRAEFPGAARRVFLLTEMVGYEQSIQDPYGASFEEWRETAKEIGMYIDQGFDRIVELAEEGARERNRPG